MAHDELGRRLVHASGSVVPALYLVDIIRWPQVKAVALVVMAIVLGLEAVRLFGSDGVPGYRLLDRQVYRRLIRPYEEDNPGGYALFVIGGTIAAFAFPPRVAVPAFLMLTIADPISGVLADNEFRRSKRPGVLAVTFGLCLLIAVPFVTLAAAVSGAAVATLADGLTPVVWGYVIDDNLGIPVGGGFVMWTVLQIGI